jgi:hypothetical protein
MALLLDVIYVFQQDSAPVHNAMTTQEWCLANLSELCQKDFWPPEAQTVTSWTAMFLTFEDRMSRKTSTHCSFPKGKALRGDGLLPERHHGHGLPEVQEKNGGHRGLVSIVFNG